MQREPSSQGEDDDEEKSVREPLTRPFSEHSNLSEDGTSSSCDKRQLTAEGHAAKPPKSGKTRVQIIDCDISSCLTKTNHKSCVYCDQNISQKIDSISVNHRIEGGGGG